MIKIEDNLKEKTIEQLQAIKKLKEAELAAKRSTLSKFWRGEVGSSAISSAIKKRASDWAGRRTGLISAGSKIKEKFTPAEDSNLRTFGKYLPQNVERAGGWIKQKGTAEGGGFGWGGFFLIFMAIAVLIFIFLGASGGYFNNIPILSAFTGLLQSNPILNRFSSQYQLEQKLGGAEGLSSGFADIFAPITNPQSYLMQQQSQWAEESSPALSTSMAPPSIAFDLFDFKASPETMFVNSVRDPNLLWVDNCEDSKIAGCEIGNSITSFSSKIKNTGGSSIENLQVYVNVTFTGYEDCLETWGCDWGAEGIDNYDTTSNPHAIYATFKCGKDSGWECCSGIDSECTEIIAGGCSNYPSSLMSSNPNSKILRYNLSNIPKGVTDSVYCKEVEFNFGDINYFKGRAEQMDLYAVSDYSTRAYFPISFIEDKYAMDLLTADKITFSQGTSVTSQGPIKMYMGTFDQPIRVDTNRDFPLKLGVINVGEGEVLKLYNVVVSIPTELVTELVFPDTNWQVLNCYNEIDSPSQCEKCYETGNCCDEAKLSPDAQRSLCYLQVPDTVTNAGQYRNIQYNSYAYKPCIEGKTEKCMSLVCTTSDCGVISTSLNINKDTNMGSALRKTYMIRTDSYYQYMKSTTEKVFIGVI